VGLLQGLAEGGGFVAVPAIALESHPPASVLKLITAFPAPASAQELDHVCRARVVAGVNSQSVLWVAESRGRLWRSPRHVILYHILI